MQIIEDEHQRRRLRRLLEEAHDRIEEEEARMLGVDHCRETGQARDLLANFGHELLDARSSKAELQGELRRHRSIHETADHLHPWPEGGRALALECAPPKDGYATIRGEISYAIRKARLADARLAASWRLSRNVSRPAHAHTSKNRPKTRIPSGEVSSDVRQWSDSASTCPL